MRVKYPGLIRETLPSGNARWRVRKEGDPQTRTAIHVAPDHPRFNEHYHAARAGIQLPPEPDQAAPIRGSIGWLVQSYLTAMNDMAATGQLAPATVHQRTQFLEWLRSEVGEYSLTMPQSQLIILRDKRSDTPGAADNFIKATRAMYAWAVQRGHAKANPAIGISRINQGAGARPWSLEDLQKFRTRHPQGTMAHLALTLFMFTACRLGDAFRLGRANEVKRDELIWLDWQPEKKGSTRVRIPILPPLLASMKAQTVIGPTYLLTGRGQPFASKNAFGNKFRDWTAQAGLSDRSPHGIRKAAGDLLAMHGASQYQIMAIHGHSNAKTSEVYTKGADRDRLAAQAMEKLAKMEW